MKKEIRKLYVDNGFFSSTVLDLFGNEKEQALLIFGANGTGKTTIGKSILNLKSPVRDITQSEIRDDVGNPVFFSDEEKKQIFVFNEDFLGSQVEFRASQDSDNGKMNAIVMFGKNVENDKIIEELKEKFKNDNQEITNLHIEKFENPVDPLSPVYYYNQIKKAASSDWAEEERLIRGNTTKPQVREDDIQKIISSLASFNKKEYEEKRATFLKLVGDPQPLTNALLATYKVPTDADKQSDLLKRAYARPIGSKLAEKITRTIQERGLTRLEEIKESFSDGYCPYCFQPIDNNYVERILQEINNIQNEEVKDFISELTGAAISKLSINLSEFYFLNKELCLEVENGVNDLNQKIERINEQINIKRDNPYDPIEIKVDFSQSAKALLDKISKLEARRLEYNAEIKNKKVLKQELQEMNIARIATANRSTIKSFQTQSKEYGNKKAAEAKLNEKINAEKKEISRLNAESQSIGIALKEINNYLGLIFLSKERLYIEEDGGKYLVKVHSKPTTLKKLSNGERNAIALCYFFTVMNENCREEEAFQKSSLVVLDDPLSSFDYNNKIGIYSFLRRMASKIMANTSSKIIVMTHQIETYFDINTVFSDFFTLKNKDKWRCAILKDKKIEKDPHQQPNVYKNLLNEIYKVASSPESVSAPEMETMGNKLRRVLEAFATFNYGCGFSSLSSNASIMSSIKDAYVRDYLENSLERIALNSSSHLQAQTYALADLLNLTYFEKDGLLRSIKDGLLLIYALNPKHLATMLGISDMSFFTDYIASLTVSLV